MTMAFTRPLCDVHVACTPKKYHVPPYYCTLLHNQALQCYCNIHPKTKVRQS